MSSETPKIIEILSRYARESVDPILADTLLSELDIDRLDLPMIALDLEDAFNVRIGFEDGIELAQTVGDVAGCVARAQEARFRLIAERASVVRVKRSWISTDAAPR